MTKTIVRTIRFNERDVREAVIAYLKTKDQPAPQYVGNTPDCEWEHFVGGSLVVKWTEKQEIG